MKSTTKNVQRSASAVYTDLKRSEVVTKSKRKGRKPRISLWVRLILVRSARIGIFLISELHSAYEPAVTVHRMPQTLTAAPNFRCARMQRSSYLTDSHKDRRLQWARKLLSRCASFYNRNIFTDEKRWTLGSLKVLPTTGRLKLCSTLGLAETEERWKIIIWALFQPVESSHQKWWFDRQHLQ